MTKIKANHETVFKGEFTLLNAATSAEVAHFTAADAQELQEYYGPVWDGSKKGTYSAAEVTPAVIRFGIPLACALANNGPALVVKAPNYETCLAVFMAIHKGYGIALNAAAEGDERKVHRSVTFKTPNLPAIGLDGMMEIMQQ